MSGINSAASRAARSAMLLRKFAIGLVLALAVATEVASQEQAPAASQPQQQQIPVSAEQALYLIRSTLLTLNDANRTGNYSVMRDLAAPEFQARNSPADLAQVFADLRRRNFDLFSVAIAAPQLSTPPYLDPGRMLRLIGFFPTRPLQINFDLTFQSIDNHWRLYGISVATPQAPPAPVASPSPAAAAKAHPPAARKSN